METKKGINKGWRANSTKKFNWKAPLLGGLMLISANFISADVICANVNRRMLEQSRQANIVKPAEKANDSELCLGDIARNPFGYEITVKKIFSSKSALDGTMIDSVVDQYGRVYAKSSLTKIMTREQAEKIIARIEKERKKSIKERLYSLFHKLSPITQALLEVSAIAAIATAFSLVIRVVFYGIGCLFKLCTGTCAFLVSLPFFLIKKLSVPSADLGELWIECLELAGFDIGSTKVTVTKYSHGVKEVSAKAQEKGEKEPLSNDLAEHLAEARERTEKAKDDAQFEARQWSNKNNDS